MKPRNKRERKVMELSEKLPPLTEKQKQWAIDKVFPHVAWSTKSSMWCSECGEVFKNNTKDDASLLINNLGEKYIICPHCGKKLEVQMGNRRRYDQEYYFTIILLHKGYQVFRHFTIEKRMRKDWIDKRPDYYVHEACQLWINNEGKMVTIARPVVQNNFYFDRWNYNYPMSIKEHGKDYEVKYDIDAEVYPHYKIMPDAVRNGFSLKKAYDMEIVPSELMKYLLENPTMEMLLKTQQYDILRDVIRYKKGEVPFLHAIRICNRNGYIVKEANMWFEHLRMLEELNLDTHNAYYVCPNDLKKAHTDILKRLEKKRERERALRDIELAKAKEEAYVKAKSRFFNLCFQNDNIHVSVLRSVKEFLEEGNAMHHCVFAMEYYEKPKSLILSARDNKGERVETVEVNLETYKVVQSRGVCNKNTPMHDTIIKLVNDNMKLIKQANKNKMEVAV